MTRSAVGGRFVASQKSHGAEHDPPVDSPMSSPADSAVPVSDVPIVADVTRDVAALVVEELSPAVVEELPPVVVAQLPKNERVPTPAEYREFLAAAKRQRMAGAEERRRFLRKHIAFVVATNMRRSAESFIHSRELSYDDKDHLPYVIELLSGYTCRPFVNESSWMLTVKVV
jgi:hypothetical protein